jgi:hypothetical protein
MFLNTSAATVFSVSQLVRRNYMIAIESIKKEIKDAIEYKLNEISQTGANPCCTPPRWISLSLIPNLKVKYGGQKPSNVDKALKDALQEIGKGGYKVQSDPTNGPTVCRP